jgi:cytochrome P450
VGIDTVGRIYCINLLTESPQIDATISAFILAMMLHPDVQRRGHEEISRVCDSGQLPSYDDVDSLPYVTAIALEVLRWTASVPVGIVLSLLRCK